MVVPLTTSEKEHDMRIDIGLIDGKKAKANISQIRVVDTKRFEEKISFLSKTEFSKLKKIVKELF